ncbi:unnamed protein product [Brassicogethes aeneus]|uniref:DUF4706 domain-containing protein n=1 Tax=Brassicogethes aeneus TaxID=1431903 RepID=A0A9P0FKZ2_BRAAE|nr:unnamed protein product [Brassicogethes aeneus]
MALKSIAEEYFKSLNPIATRLCEDMDEVKNTYEELWSTLSEDQQSQILSESIIKPEVLVKYDASKSEDDNKEYAVKLIIDDHCSYRDEHSGPFSFRSQSQRNLSIFDKEKKTTNNTSNIIKPKPKKNSIVYVEDNVMQVEVDEDNDLPRTGLDFLDNW